MPSPRNMAIVVESVHHGNTRQIAEAMSEVLRAKLFTTEQASMLDCSHFDLVGLGSGIYFGRHHRSLRKLVDNWTRPPVNVFVFSTAGLPFLWRLQHIAIRRRLVHKGCQVAAEFCCRGWDTVGPLWFLGGINRRHPGQRDLNRARQFAEQLLANSQLVAVADKDR